MLIYNIINGYIANVILVVKIKMVIVPGIRTPNLL